MAPSGGIQESWVARYNGPGNYTDDPVAIAVDGSGNVYVTGGSSGQGGLIGYATIKYNSAGEEQWVARYNGPGNGNDRVNAITVDASGNVYVTGESYGLDSAYDYATIKYNSAGQEQWVARYNGPANYDDVAEAIALDGSANVYVTGYSYGVDNAVMITPRSNITPPDKNNRFHDTTGGHVRMTTPQRLPLTAPEIFT